jgi:hypothetical protein
MIDLHSVVAFFQKAKWTELAVTHKIGRVLGENIINNSTVRKYVLMLVLSTKESDICIVPESEGEFMSWSISFGCQCRHFTFSGHEMLRGILFKYILLHTLCRCMTPYEPNYRYDGDTSGDNWMTFDQWISLWWGIQHIGCRGWTSISKLFEWNLNHPQTLYVPSTKPSTAIQYCLNLSIHSWNTRSNVAFQWTENRIDCLQELIGLEWRTCGPAFDVSKRVEVARC